MPLPKLPKQNKSKEADFGLVFRKWWNKNKLPGEIELKHTRGKQDFLFSELSHEQEVIGKLALSDCGVLVRRSSGTTGGADYSGLINVPYYWVVIKYPKHFYVIPLRAFLEERDRSTRKSLTEERAAAIALLKV